ncbi:MAG: DNA recombination protein RmuC, partial [Kaistella sp.]
ALKGQTKTQGDWGEMILERILEDSGLTKDREYFSQYTIKNEHGENQRPDFVLKLPGNQIVIIDSKVSLNAYERMVYAENEGERKQNLMLHITAVKKHIDSLSQKKYDDLKDSLDFTIMFIPVEPAFLTAVQFDSQLWNYAYHKQIILLSPTNLIAYLKLISDVWKRADQNSNALEIAERGGKLYDKFVSFVENLEKVGKNIDLAKNSYTDAFKQLATGNDNLVTQTQKLKLLGAKNRKNLSPTLIENADNQIDFSE